MHLAGEVAPMSRMNDRVKLNALESIETASVDELRTLQLERLRWSLLHTYENVAHYRNKCEAVGVHPADLTRLEGVTTQVTVLAPEQIERASTGKAKRVIDKRTKT
jgi:phenylacetate-coenzyme A ligase PaaK-like adenylate-forming protein